MTSPGAISGTAADDHLVRYEVAVAPGPPGTSEAFSPLGESSTSVVDGRLADWVSLPPDGSYTLRVLAQDAAANVAEVRIGVTIDTQPPSPPVGLTTTVESETNVRLEWQSNTEPDVVGYHVWRDGVLQTSEPVSSTTYVDAALTDALYTYTVTAVDRAGLESEPSAPTTARIDRTPPSAALHLPSDGDRVGGLVDILGTAHSADDFREYRLDVESAGGSVQALRTSPVPVLSDVLAQWNTSTLPDESTHTLRLEAEDLAGNVALATATVVVDNQPPSAPTGLVATVTGSDVALSWTAGADPDLAGYLLYRDGVLANAVGAVIGSLEPYVLTSTSFADDGRPDGTSIYEVYAIDEAGNLSGPSTPAEATVETRAPSAVIVQPEDGAAFEGDLYVLAVSDDSDIERVLFQQRAAGATVWTDIASAVDDAPWEIDWDPGAQALPFGDYELRAVATDFGGSSDPAPVVTTVIFTDLTRPAAVSGLSALVDGGDVTLSWQPNATDSDLEGYHVDRVAENSTPVRLTVDPITVTSYTDVGLVDRRYSYTVVAVDGVGNESDPSGEAAVEIYTPGLVQPYTPTTETAVDVLGFEARAGATAEATVTLGGSSVPLTPVTVQEDGGFVLTAAPLSAGESTIQVSVVDGDGNRSKSASVRVVVGIPPSAPTGLAAVPAGGFDVALSWDPNPEPDVIAYRILRDGLPLPPAVAMADATALASSESGVAMGAVLAIDGNPFSCWSPHSNQPLPGQWLEVSWPERRLIPRVQVDWRIGEDENDQPVSESMASWDLEAWDGAVWVPLFSMRGNDDPEVTVALEPGYLTDRMRLRLAEGAVSGCLAELAVVHHPLVAGTSGLDSTTDGTYEYQVIALDDRGFESMPSDVATLDVGDVEPPEPVVLSAVVSGSDVSLTWTASTSPDVDHYDLFRDGDRIAQHSDLGNLALVDANLANGTYGYTLVVVDQVGNASEPSNEASAIVAVAPPPAPTSLTVSAPQIGGALDLVWNAVAGDPVAGYRVARSTSAGGPYTAVATTPDLVLRDEGLTNGVTYFYVVHALDVVGNASPPSNEASGTPSDALPPAAPVFLAPAPSGSSVTTTLPQVLVAGLAEPGTSVEVTRDGRPLPSVVALASEQRVEVSGLPFEVVPRLSSYGRRAWLEASGDHWLVDFNTGSALEVDLPEAEQVRWLPDASGIVYVGGDETELRRRTLDGIETVLGTAEFLAAGALPSPDGKSYAVIAERGDFGLWLLDAVDETWTLLFEDSELVSSSLAFSPDGTQLAYQRGESSTVGVWVIELATGVETFVFDDAWSGIPPRWSPSGNRLLFATSEGGQQLWTWSLADGDVTAVSEVLFGLSDVVFGPEGSAVVYAVEDDGIFRLPLEGGETELLEEAFGEPRLDRASTGDLLLAHGGDAIRLRPAGSFQLPGVLLEAGDNLFAATSFDQAGNASSAADPITVTLEGGGLPDLALDASELTVFPAVPRLGETAQLSVVVRNLGSVAAPSGDLALVLIAADGSVATLPTGAVPALAPGSSIAVTVDHLFAGEPGLYRLTAAVDPLQQIVETSDDNNQVEIGFAVARDGQPLVTVTTDREQYLADQDVFAEVSLYNFDGPLTDRLVVSVEDEQGFEVVQLADEAIVDLQYGDSRTLAVTWNTGTTFAGEYRIAARLLDGSAEAFAPFTLAEASTLAAVVTTDRAAYPSGALVQISGVVEYVAGNTALQNLSTRLRVADFEGVVTAEWLQSLGDLLPENSYAVAAVWESSAASSGTYSVELDVLREEEVVATASTSFLLDEAGLDVTGSLIAADAAPAVGFPLELTFTLTNSGTVPLSEVPVTVSLREPADGAVLAEVPTVMDLPVASSAEGSASFDTTPLGLGTFVVILEAELPAGSDATTVTLDTLAVSTVDRTPPQVTLVTPEEGATLGADALVEAIVQDALSRVDAVELSLDGGLWLAMSPADEATGSYRHALDGISAGSHTLAVRARDAADNQSESVEVRFEVSLLPLLTATKVDAMSTDADGDGSPSPGDTLRYTITVTSSGEAPATAVRLDDVLPPELTVVPGSVVSSAGTVLDESPVAIDFGTLDPGTEAVVTFDALVDSALPASVFEVANQGAVTSAELPAVLTDDPARVGTADATVTTLTPKPLLIAEKTVELAVDSNADGEASAGDTLGYRIRIFNDGNVPATSVSLSDPIPLATAIVTDSVATSAGAVTSEDPVTVAIGEVDPGEEVIVTFDVAIIDPLPSGVFEVSNQGLVTSAELPDLPTDDPTTSTSADPTITPLAGEPVLEAEKVALLVDDVGGDGEVSPGDGLLYQVTLTNAGGREATAIQFGDPIPDGTTIEPGSVQTSQGTVLGEDPVLVDLGTLDAGSEATVSFRVRIDAAVPPSGEVVNQGALESAELAPVPTDDPNTAEPDDPTRTPVADPPVLVVSDVSVLEAAGHVQFVVTLDRTTLADIEIGVTTTDGTALAGSDYVPLSGPVIIEAGADSALVEVAVSGDSLFESDEVFFLDVTQADGVVVADGRGAAQIVDDDPAPTLAVDDAEATEGDAGTTSASVTFELDAVSGLDASVAWSTAPGTAQSGVDYVEDSGVLTIPAGEIAGDVTVSVLGDEIDEGDESFSILLSGPENVSLASPSAGVSILDDDLAEISVADAELLEGAEGELPVAGVSVELSTAADREIQVRWTTAEDSAEAGVDYEPAEGTVAFEAGETAAELDIQVIGDDLLEDDEALRVELSDPVGSTIGYGVGLLTILDDELCVGPNLLVNPGAEAALEGDEIPAWTEVEGDEWMRWETLPEPAEGEASFYAGVAGPGGWAELIQEVDLTPYGERIDGGRQMFAFSGAVRTLDEVPPDVARIVVEYLDDTGQVLDLWDSGDLSSPLDWTFVSDTRVVPITTRRARVRLVSTLFAGDTVDGFFDALALTALRAPALTIGDVQVIEGDAEAAFVISLTCPWENEVTVTFATADGSAVAGEDYVATTGDLAIAAGETSATVTVPLLTDSVAEGEEYFELNLETATTGIDTEPVVVLDATGVCTLVEAGDCAPEPLGTVGEFNVFVFESVIQNATDVEGRLAAGTSAQLSNYSAGLQLADTGGDVLVVGTDLIFSGGTVHHGDVVVGGTAQLLGVDIVDGVLRQDSPIDFAAERAAIESLSAHLSTLPANGVTFVQPSKAIELEGTDLVLNVFGLMASDLSQASSVSIDVPVGSSVLINVDGASAVMQFFGFALSGAEPADVIYHFPDAISLVMQGIGVEGSVLAPQAHVQFNNGQLDGSLVARTLQGNGQANVGLFEGCLPLPDGETFCPRSPGYWKNHPGAWPVSELELGGTLYDQAGVQELLEYGGPDAASKLGRALSATELNIASGFQHPDLPPVLADAHAFLEVHPPGSNPKGAAKGQANALKDALEDFYSGASCDE
ncbi:MAG: choice-of-anchor A family protein [Thermoanaerobaculia bacterium]|nr:choice-of-anchor A family protein [Thermoanaerobaculia bacterium]